MAALVAVLILLKHIFLKNINLVVPDMKKSLILIAVLIVAFSASAQEKKEGNPQERFFQAKVREMVYRLNITDEQKPEFVKVYRAYTDEMRQAYGEGRPQRPAPKNDIKKGEKPEKTAAKPDGNEKAKPERKKLTKEEVVKIEKEKVERQQRVQAVKAKYIDELAAVLDANQLARFFKVEQQIQQKLRSRQQGRGKPGMKGNRPQGQRSNGTAEIE